MQQKREDLWLLLTTKHSKATEQYSWEYLPFVCAILFYDHLFFFLYIILCLLPQSIHTITRLLSAQFADSQI